MANKKDVTVNRNKFEKLQLSQDLPYDVDFIETLEANQTEANIEFINSINALADREPKFNKLVKIQKDLLNSLRLKGNSPMDAQIKSAIAKFHNDWQDHCANPSKRKSQSVPVVVMDDRMQALCDAMNKPEEEEQEEPQSIAS